MSGRVAILIALVALVLVGGAYALSVGPFTAEGLTFALHDPEFYTELGYRLGVEGDWDGAQRAFAQALALEPRESTRLNLAVASFHAGDYNEAIAQYRILHDGDVGNRMYRFDLAQSIVAHARTVETDVDAAIAQLQEALALLESVNDYPHARENAEIIRAVLSEAI